MAGMGNLHPAHYRFDIAHDLRAAQQHRAIRTGWVDAGPGGASAMAVWYGIHRQYLEESSGEVMPHIKYQPELSP